RLCQARDREGPYAELLHDGPAVGIAESMEDAIDVHFLTEHSPLPFPRARGLAREFLGQLFEQLAPTLFAYLRPIGAFKECGLLREDEVGSIFRRQKLECGQGRGDALFAQ